MDAHTINLSFTLTMKKMNQVVHLMYPTNRHDTYIMNYVECFCETGLHVSQPAMAVWRGASMRNTITLTLKQLKKIQASLILVFTRLLFLL